MKPLRGPIVLLTDFGLRDWYVAAMKGVILSRCPTAQLIDLTHDVPPQDVRAGAFILAAAVPWFPPGTGFVAVVDPGVGSARAVVAAQADGRWFVGPDNGVLAPSLERAGRRSVVRLANPRYWLHPVSQTFHGRDIMAPVAAYLARGGVLQRLGPPQPRWALLDLPVVERHARRLRGTIIHIDRFGNLITNLPAAQCRPGHGRLWYRGRMVPMVSSYAEGRPRQLIALIGSLGYVELAVRERSAAQLLGARRGERVEWRR
jgi:S-adenosylmethionine hydrolase